MVAEFDTIIDHVVDVCGVDPLSVGIEYRRGSDSSAGSSWSVRVDIRRVRSRNQVTVCGYGDTASEAAEDAIASVRTYVESGDYKTPRGVKSGDSNVALERAAAKRRAECIAACVEMGMDQAEAERKFDAMIARELLAEQDSNQ